ncbi:MAG: P-loop NTPase [Actinomycetota bacterium]
MAGPKSHPIPSPAKFTLAVGSGKGGVGKSTLSLNLALALAEGGAQTGLLDADLQGPDIPRMINIARREPIRAWDLWRSRSEGGLRLEPVTNHGVKIMSAGFLLAEDQALVWDSNLIDLVLRLFLEDVPWGDLDVLVFDLPPGTGEVVQHLLRRVSLSGALVVVTPQDVAHLDARKAVTMYRSAGVKVVGGVENMSGLICPHCGDRVEIFPSVSPERSVWKMGVEQLGRVPMDPGVAVAGDAGRPFLAEHPNSPSAIALNEIAARLKPLLEG